MKLAIKYVVDVEMNHNIQDDTFEAEVKLNEDLNTKMVFTPKQIEAIVKNYMIVNDIKLENTDQVNLVIMEFVAQGFADGIISLATQKLQEIKENDE